MFAAGLEALRSVGRGQSEAVEVDCKDGGAPLRFLLSLAAIMLSPAASYLTGVMLPVDGGALRVI